MSSDLRFARGLSLPWDASALIAFYEHSHPVFRYREEVLKFALEAHKLFVSGFPVPSIIMSGEALLRAIYDRIVVLVTQQDQVINKNINGRPLVIRASDIGENPWEWDDRLTFNGAIWVLKRSRVYSESLIDRMFVIKELRNRAIHGQLPQLELFDPDEPRSKEDFIKLLKGDFEISEGYRFRPPKNRRKWVTFACRDHGVGTLSEISSEDRYAAIQYVFAIETIAGMLSFPKKVSGH